MVHFSLECYIMTEQEHKKVLRLINYPTINRFFEWEDYDINDFVLKGVIHIVRILMLEFF